MVVPVVRPVAVHPHALAEIPSPRPRAGVHKRTGGRIFRRSPVNPSREGREPIVRPARQRPETVVHEESRRRGQSMERLCHLRHALREQPRHVRATHHVPRLRRNPGKNRRVRNGHTRRSGNPFRPDDSRRPRLRSPPRHGRRRRSAAVPHVERKSLEVVPWSANDIHALALFHSPRRTGGANAVASVDECRERTRGTAVAARNGCRIDMESRRSRSARDNRHADARDSRFHHCNLTNHPTGSHSNGQTRRNPTLG